MDITTKVKIQLAKLLQQFSETVLKDSQGNDITLISDMPLTVGSEVFITNENGEPVPAPNGDYKGEDETVYTVLDGFITVVTPKVQEEETKTEPEAEIKQEATPTIDELVNAISPVIEEAITKVKSEILAEVDAKLSKLSFSKPADVEINDKETKVSTGNRAAQILGSK